MKTLFRWKAMSQAALLLLAGCASPQRSNLANGEADLKLRLTSKDILLEISNATTKSITLENLDGLSMLPDQPGFAFEIFDRGGKKHQLCSLVEPNVSNQTVVLRSGDSKQVGFSSAFIARIYCLDGGKYTAQAILYVRNAASGKLASIASNRAELDITRQ